MLLNGKRTSEKLLAVSILIKAENIHINCARLIRFLISRQRRLQ